MIQNIRPGVDENSPEVLEARNQLRWLVDKGHVIEFSDGRLAVPVNAISRVQHAKKGKARASSDREQPESKPEQAVAATEPAAQGGNDGSGDNGVEKAEPAPISIAEQV